MVCGLLGARIPLAHVQVFRLQATDAKVLGSPSSVFDPATHMSQLKGPRPQAEQASTYSLGTASESIHGQDAHMNMQVCFVPVINSMMPEVNLRPWLTPQKILS